MNKLKRWAVASIGAVAFFGAVITGVSASVGDIGTDTSIHNGYNVPRPYGKETFNISQIGGIFDNSVYGQPTYETQMAQTINQGQRAHTYLWFEGGSTYQANLLANIFLPQITGPKGSIVAVDYERNASWSKEANTIAIITLMRRIKDAGYTPMLYGYKVFLQDNVYTDQVVDRYGTCLWVAEYPNYAVTPEPNYNYFPSMRGVALFQFTSTYSAPSLDASVDLTGITDNGYTKATTKHPTPAQGDKQANKEANAKTVSFKNVYVVDKWVQYNGQWYGINNDMAQPRPVDYNQLIPVAAFTLTDRYGNRLANQNIQGNNGVIEFATFDGHCNILDKSADGQYVKIEMNGEPVWLSSNYVTFD
ncbi:GH25 family lysozyme [Leuconostoc citreum]|uniref:GH25 family lysozyme n=1 Tax=Leuconostoc citreum TaxID=33964 RepID=UPI0002F8FEC2|nr:GH25 family lysozyme [Leuconostoc citreum]